jgi:preprotein translocase subunit SecG
MLTSLVVALHVMVALVMIVVVLLQSGKGAGLGSGFGGSSQTVFGSRGPAGFLSKFTTASAVLFMVTSLMLSVMSSKVGKSSIADTIQSKQPAASTTVDPFKAVHEVQQKGMPAPAAPGQQTAPAPTAPTTAATDKKGQPTAPAAKP